MVIDEEGDVIRAERNSAGVALDRESLDEAAGASIANLDRRAPNGSERGCLAVDGRDETDCRIGRPASPLEVEVADDDRATAWRPLRRVPFPRTQTALCAAVGVHNPEAF